MSEVMDTIQSWPWGWAWLTFFVIVLLRAGATYGLGRAMAAGVTRKRPPGETMRAATEKVDRWGPPAVTLSFLTVGAQTAINLAAGLAGMTFPRYLLGLVPGAALWATLWTTVGVGLVTLLRSSADDKAVLIGLVVAVVALTAVVAVRTARRRE
ncbi:MAG: VTT domain-containing protein [Aeromicrobium sp.]|uniref:DedA family protein n=1 Tax=Aeromicrobium sp. TaxID=1871063 RepID=UPI0039E71381